ncbi:recombinase family protein [Pseudomonas sp. P1.31]|uniref:recombinase family protein n=1 Tax=Pseudomonas sp. P1.31 TaxID=1699311 RepID=UPI00069D79A1|nr:recombinase family protein [Pseudomonas sp. P1.31]
MALLGYVRVSSDGQSVEAQRHSLGSTYNIEKWFEDSGVSGAVKALERPGFRALADFARQGDVLLVSAVDRLGRDTLDVLSTVEMLQGKGVSIISQREGFDLSKPIGKAMLTMLSAVAELERSNIKARQMAGIERARSEGRPLGRKPSVDSGTVTDWRRDNSASIKETATHFGVSESTIKRLCAMHWAVNYAPE